ncbi:MAG: hypothetical protein R2695_04840 [Acidimicrobiales bacterium]
MAVGVSVRATSPSTRVSKSGSGRSWSASGRLSSAASRLAPTTCRHHSFAEFETTSIDGLDVVFEDGKTYDVSLTGNLTVKETTREETFAGVTVDLEQLTADVSTTVLLSSTTASADQHQPDSPTPATKVGLRFTLVADRVNLDAEADTDLSSGAGGGGGGGVPPPPSSRSSRRCVSCHTSGGRIWDTMAFDTPPNEPRNAWPTRRSYRVRCIPPWLPGGDSPSSSTTGRSPTTRSRRCRGVGSRRRRSRRRPDTELVARNQAIIPIEEDGSRSRDGVHRRDRRNGVPTLKDDYRCPGPCGRGSGATAPG